jgi:hypothetical protein
VKFSLSYAELANPLNQMISEKPWQQPSWLKAVFNGGRTIQAIG